MKRGSGGLGRSFQVLAASLFALWLVLAASGRFLWPFVVNRSPVSCELPIAVAVPPLEALPVSQVRAVRLTSGTLCRVVIQGPGAVPRDALAVLSGTALMNEGASRPARLGILLVAQRSDAVLVNRTPMAPHFLWHDLAGQVVVLPDTEGDLGPLIVEALLRHHEIREPLLLRGLTVKAFIQGNGAYVETSLTQGLKLVVRAKGHIATYLGIQTGPTPAAVRTAKPAYVRSHRGELDELARAIYQDSLHLAQIGSGNAYKASPNEPGVQARLEAARLRLWATDPRLDSALFVRLGALMAQAGEAAAPPPAGRLLTGPAEYALRKALASSPSDSPATVRHE